MRVKMNNHEKHCRLYTEVEKEIAKIDPKLKEEIEVRNYIFAEHKKVMKLNNVKHIEITSEVFPRGKYLFTEELDKEVPLVIRIKLITVEGNEIEVDSWEGIKLLPENIIKILDNARNRIHQYYDDSYAENKDLWINFICEVLKNPDLEKKATYSVKITKDILEQDDFIDQYINHQFDKLLYVLRRNAKEVNNAK